jgi:hypothetical protein
MPHTKNQTTIVRKPVLRGFQNLPAVLTKRKTAITASVFSIMKKLMILTAKTTSEAASVSCEWPSYFAKDKSPFI